MAILYLNVKAIAAYTVQIIGFSHDELTDGTGKAAITLGLKQLLTAHYNMNITGTNEGGWRDSYMRNTNMPLIYNMLPAELQAVVKTVNKKSGTGPASSADTETVVTEDKLFLFSVSETYRSTTAYADEGALYECYIDGLNASRQKMHGNSYTSYFLRSISSLDKCFIGIGYNGTLGINYSATQSNIYTTFGFCV